MKNTDDSSQMDPDYKRPGVRRINRNAVAVVLTIGFLIAAGMLYAVFTAGKRQQQKGDVLANVKESDSSGLFSGKPEVIDMPQSNPVVEQKPAPPAGPDPAMLAEMARLRREAAELRAQQAAAAASAPSVIPLNGRLAVRKEKPAPVEPVGVGTDGLPGVLPPLHNEAEIAYGSRKEDGDAILSFKVQNPASGLELKAGNIINAVLISGINSDLPGTIIAQVSQNVYDTRTGDYLLIPQGTRLVGTYGDKNAYGAERVAVVWNRVVMPNGLSLTFGLGENGMIGGDEAGYSGFKDKVNHHYLRVYGSAFLLSGLSAGIELSRSDTGTAGNGQNGGQSGGDVMQQSMSIGLGQAITETLRKNINIEPTIEIRPGFAFAILVNRDLTFEKPYRNHINFVGAPPRIKAAPASKSIVSQALGYEPSTK